MEIILKNLQKKIPIPKVRILSVAKAAFHKLGLGAWGLSIAFVGARRMRTLNKGYLGHDYVTDVLTFDLGGNQGEIIICPEAAHKNAKEYHSSTDSEIILYVIHGILHLAGYKDHHPKDIQQMRKMEKELLNIPSPNRWEGSGVLIK